MDYETLYTFIKDLLSSVYGVAIPTIPQQKKGKTYADYSTGGKCSWSDKIIPVYIPKEWEKDPTEGQVINE